MSTICGLPSTTLFTRVTSSPASDITFAVRAGADFIAASFVGDAEDVAQVRRLIEREGAQTAIISKRKR